MTPDRKEGMRHLLGLVVGFASFVLGTLLLVGPFFLAGVPHSNVRDIIAGGCLGFAFICAVPSKVDKAAQVFQKTSPWGRRSSDRDTGDRPVKETDR